MIQNINNIHFFNDPSILFGHNRLVTHDPWVNKKLRVCCMKTFNYQLKKKSWQLYLPWLERTPSCQLLLSWQVSFSSFSCNTPLTCAKCKEKNIKRLKICVELAFSTASQHNSYFKGPFHPHAAQAQTGVKCSTSAFPCLPMSGSNFGGDLIFRL